MAELGPVNVTERMIELIDQAINNTDVDTTDICAIGIGVPGTVNMKTGSILFLPNLPGQWRNVRLSEIIEQSLGFPTYLINDVRAITYAEWQYGAGSGCQTLACFAIGTGIGGGLVIDGRFHQGIRGTAGELGHIIVEPDGLPCGCGGSGCLEMYASGPAIAAAGVKFLLHGHTTQIGKLSDYDLTKITAELVVKAAMDGDVRSKYIIERAGYYLGIATSNILVSISPEMIIFGGGVAEAGDILLDPIRNEVKKRVYMMPADEVVITTAKLGNNAGMIGAASWAYQNAIKS